MFYTKQQYKDMAKMLKSSEKYLVKTHDKYKDVKNCSRGWSLYICCALEVSMEHFNRNPPMNITETNYQLRLCEAIKDTIQTRLDDCSTLSQW